MLTLAAEVGYCTAAAYLGSAATTLAGLGARTLLRDLDLSLVLDREWERARDDRSSGLSDMLMCYLVRNGNVGILGSTFENGIAVEDTRSRSYKNPSIHCGAAEPLD